MKQSSSLRLRTLSPHGLYPTLAVTLLVVLLGFAAVSMAPMAYAAAPTTHAASVSRSQASHCVIVLAPLQPGERNSKTVFSQCAALNQPLVVPLASTLLITVYLGDNFTGSRTSIFGNAGPCDPTGYKIDRMPTVNGVNFNNDISSYKVFHNCSWTRDYSGNNETGDCVGTFLGDVSSLAGTGIDNRINSMRLSSVFHSC